MLFKNINMISIFEKIEIKYYRFIQNSTEDIGDDGWRVFNSLADGDEFVHSFLHPQWGLVSSSDSASTNEASWMLLLGLMRMMVRSLLMWWRGMMHLMMIIGHGSWYSHFYEYISTLGYKNLWFYLRLFQCII